MHSGSKQWREDAKNMKAISCVPCRSWLRLDPCHVLCSSAMWKTPGLILLACSLPLPARDARGQDVVLRLTGTPAIEGRTVVVSAPQDSYHGLALEISRDESTPCYENVDLALSAEPRFVLWVGSPAYFTDKVLAQAGLALKSTHSAAGIGIISGKTIEEARALYLRRKEAGGVKAYAVNGEYPPAQVMRGRILTSSGRVMGRRNLSKSELVEVLKDANYVTFTGHGGGSYWRLAEGDLFTSADLPMLPPLVLTTASCQGMRLNSDNSMALGAVGHGSAAYAGFLFSPIEGYLIGEFDGLPCGYTWPGVTIGEVIRLQNRGSEQAFAAFPFYFLLGDPRIALQPEASWSPLGIETVRGVRTLNYGEAPPGFFPIRIKNGARYHFIEIPGVASASDNDLFYNARLQFMNAGADKLVLLLHAGGELKISMQADAPRLWWLTHSLLDSLDHTLLFILIPPAGMPWVSVCIAGAALLGIIFLMRRQAQPRPVMMRSILLGSIMGLAHMLYVLARIDLVTITSKPIAIGPLEIVGTALLTSCGSILFWTGESILRKIAAVAVAVFPSLGAAAVSFGLFFGINTFYARRALGTGIYNYSMTWIALFGGACQALVFLLVAVAIGRLRRPAYNARGSSRL